MTSATSQVGGDFFGGLADRLDRAGEQPLYRQLARLVRRGIEAGEIQPGTVVPSQRQLSARLGVAEVTVRRALRDLAGEGLLDARAGGGTVVRDPSQVVARAVEREETGRPLSLGVAFADLADGYPFMRPLLEGIRDTASPVAVRAFDVPQGEMSTQALASSLPLEGMDGLVAMSPVNLRLLALCQERQLPCVLLFSDIADGYTRCLVVNYARGMRQAVDHLTRQGSRRIALVTAGADRYSTGQWLDAHCDALEAADVALDSTLVVHAGYDEANGYRAAKALLERDDRPDAIVFASDFLARGGLLAAHELNLRVPEDVRIVGAGRLLGDEGWSRSLATIDLGIEELGSLARQMLEAAAGGRTIHFPYRASVGSHFVSGDTA